MASGSLLERYVYVFYENEKLSKKKVRDFFFPSDEKIPFVFFFSRKSQNFGMLDFEQKKKLKFSRFHRSKNIFSETFVIFVNYMNIAF